MVLIKLSGGLGNQLHQYVYGVLMAEKLGIEVFFEINDLTYNAYKKKYAVRELAIEKVFDLTYPLRLKFAIPKLINYNPVFRRLFMSTKLLMGNIKKVYQDLDREVSQYFQSARDNTFLIGLFADYDLLESKKSSILQLLSFKRELKTKFEIKVNDILSKEAVAIHVRRGDYLWVQHSDFNICTMEYFEKAVELIEEKIKQPVYYIFSDDIEWCKQHFDFIQKAKICFVDFTNPQNSGEDLYCMSQCKHFIVSNSTFSYWGAFLSNNSQKIVIAPKKWFQIKRSMKLPPDWVGIEF